jgi:hypothetical protein
METIGYIAEYYVNDIFMGYLPHEYKGEVVGFMGRSRMIAYEDIVIKKGRKILKGQEYIRIIYPLHGKIKNGQ